MPQFTQLLRPFAGSDPLHGSPSLRTRLVSRTEREAIGRAMRESRPISAIGTWDVVADRPQVVELIEASHDGRLEHLVPIRVARMIGSPYGFLRGSAVVMADDVARLPVSGITPVIGGDSHLGNFGFYRSPEGELVIDINDFDEAHVGAWEWDLARLTASIWVAGRENSLGEDACRSSVEACVRAYAGEVARLARIPLLARSFERMDVTQLAEAASDPGLRTAIQRAAKSARKRTSDRVLPKLTSENELGEREIVAEPPLVERLDRRGAEEVAQGLDHYLTTLPAQWRRVLAWYQLSDVAHKVVGVGSVGLRAYVALLEGTHPDDVLFLQLKQARRSVLARYVHGEHAWHDHQGQRVVESQQALQTVSDPLLGWTTFGGNQYYVRTFRNMKGTVPLDGLDAAALADYSHIVGTLLAKGHARTSGASMIAAYLGDDDAPAQAFAAFARGYADQTEADHATLVAAVRAGRLPVAEGFVGSAFRPGDAPA
ncbi:DUF2252 domain-containing protein [Serinibacter arcticus]|uniref:DUF2252 domain-containing protein n=1 Tax=Serinibacter arcticus TaxID=1655435 RepID=A0A4Z1EB08_9MICO|nr:DUF2252 domain-containing protein [Serinibacter arcticus]TGO06611.1 hypothetical protein SERN_0803 [Serinibacter arcticus]